MIQKLNKKDQTYSDKNHCTPRTTARISPQPPISAQSVHLGRAATRPAPPSAQLAVVEHMKQNGYR